MRVNFLNIMTLFVLSVIFCGQALASTEYSLSIKDHQFEPAELVIPANQKVRIKITNLDSTAEEFESDELDREKLVAGNASVVIFIGPLSPGVYPFIGEFNPDTAKGWVKAE